MPYARSQAERRRRCPVRRAVLCACVGQAVRECVRQAVRECVRQAVRECVRQTVREYVRQAVREYGRQCVRECVGQAVREHGRDYPPYGPLGRGSGLGGRSFWRN